MVRQDYAKMMMMIPKLLYPIICTLIWAVLIGELGPVSVLCVLCFFLTRTSLFLIRLASVTCVFFMYLVVLWLSAPVQSIPWKDSSPKWPVIVSSMCRLNSLTHSLTHSLFLHLLLDCSVYISGSHHHLNDRDDAQHAAITTNFQQSWQLYVWQLYGRWYFWRARRRQRVPVINRRRLCLLHGCRVCRSAVGVTCSVRASYSGYASFNYDSRGSKAISGVWLGHCTSVCLFVRTIEPKWLKLYNHQTCHRDSP